MPVIMAGIRVATVANIAMVSVGALIGVPSLGTLFTDGLARNIPSEILAGVILSLLLALALDLLLYPSNEGTLRPGRRLRLRTVAAPKGRHNP